MDQQKNLVIEGWIENGVVKIPSFWGIAERTLVRVEILEDQPLKKFLWEEFPDDGTPLPTLAETYREFIGSADSGVGDLAANHDHYLYGTSKREEHPPKPANEPPDHPKAE